jgi:hypothetical protein
MTMPAGPARAVSRSGGSAALIAGRAARAYGAAPPASRLLRIADATAVRACPDPEPLRPLGQETRAGQACPARRAPRPAISTPPGGHHDRGPSGNSLPPRSAFSLTSAPASRQAPVDDRR